MLEYWNFKLNPFIIIVLSITSPLTITATYQHFAKGTFMNMLKEIDRLNDLYGNNPATDKCLNDCLGTMKIYLLDLKQYLLDLKQYLVDKQTTKRIPLS